MALICLGSARAAPGVTTLAVLLAGTWPRPAVLVEADPAGGVLAPRYGMALDPGLSGLAAALHQGRPADVFTQHAQELPGGLPAVVASPLTDRSTAVLDDSAALIASAASDSADLDVFVDCGRLSHRSPVTPLVRAADRVLVVCRPRADELYAAAGRVQVFGGGLVLVGDRPYGSGEVTGQLGVEVVGVVADDPRPARAMVDGGSARTLARSPLVRTVRAFAQTLAGHLDEPAHGDWAPSEPLGGVGA